MRRYSTQFTFMKKIIGLFAAIALFFSCQQGNEIQQICIEKVKDYNERIHPINKEISHLEYSALDSLYTDVYSTEAYQSNRDKIVDTYKTWEYAKGRRETFSTMRDIITTETLLSMQHEIKELLQREQELKKKFRPQFKGYALFQIYQYQTEFGDSINLGYYVIDPELNNVYEGMFVDFAAKVYPQMTTNGKVFTDNLMNDLKRFGKVDKDSTGIGIYYSWLKEPMEFSTLTLIDTLKFIKP